jgi:hypothetical protein
VHDTTADSDEVDPGNVVLHKKYDYGKSSLTPKVSGIKIKTKTLSDKPKALIRPAAHLQSTDEGDRNTKVMLHERQIFSKIG